MSARSHWPHAIYIRACREDYRCSHTKLALSSTTTAQAEPSCIFRSLMDQLYTTEAILFPADGRIPHLVSLMSSPINEPYNIPGVGQVTRMPHPEIHMDRIADSLGYQAWSFHLIQALDGMNRSFAAPYVVFYPTVSRDGRPFPLNKMVQEIQGHAFQESTAWRGNIVVAKYRGSPFMNMVDISMADYPLIRNWFLTHGQPQL